MVKYKIWIRISIFPYSGEKVGSHTMVVVVIAREIAITCFRSLRNICKCFNPLKQLTMETNSQTLTIKIELKLLGQSWEGLVIMTQDGDGCFSIQEDRQFLIGNVLARMVIHNKVDQEW
jgi:hypothetical protein